jgi:hypothetical protein
LFLWRDERDNKVLRVGWIFNSGPSQMAIWRLAECHGSVPSRHCSRGRFLGSDRSRWIFQNADNGILDGRIDGNRLVVNDFGAAKNIFKKLVKIPPGELQRRGVVVKREDEDRIR